MAARRRGEPPSDLHAKEVSMSFTADVYHAVLGANQPAEQFTAFNVDPSGPPGDGPALPVRCDSIWQIRRRYWVRGDGPLHTHIEQLHGQRRRAGHRAGFNRS